MEDRYDTKPEHERDYERKLDEEALERDWQDEQRLDERDRDLPVRGQA